jgi:hypothetical protein
MRMPVTAISCGSPQPKTEVMGKVGKPISPLDRRSASNQQTTVITLAFRERDIGVEPTTFSLGS